MNKIPNQPKTDIELIEYFITNTNYADNDNITNKNSNMYIYTVNILKIFIFPLFIFTQLFKQEFNIISIYLILFFLIYFAIFAVITYIIFTNILIKDGTIQSIELIRNIIAWIIILFCIIVFVHR